MNQPFTIPDYQTAALAICNGPLFWIMMLGFFVIFAHHLFTYVRRIFDIDDVFGFNLEQTTPHVDELHEKRKHKNDEQTEKPKRNAISFRLGDDGEMVADDESGPSLDDLFHIQDHK